MSRRTGDKARAIMDAAVSVFAEQGYHQAQMARIARVAGVAGGTIYLYFRNKQDLLISLFRDRLGRLIERCLSESEGFTDPIDRLRAFVAHHLGALGANREFAVVTQIELRQADPEIRRAISEIMRGYFAVIDGIIADGQASGCIRPEIPPRLIRNMIFGTLDQLVTAWVISGASYDLAALAEPTSDMLLGGIAARVAAKGGR